MDHRLRPLSDEQLELLELEPGVSNIEIEAERAQIVGSSFAN
jgi:hypothetical protein